MAFNRNKFRGTGVAIVTPFHKDGSIDFRALERLIEHLVKGSVEYLVALGTTGESVTLSKDEKTAILSHVAQCVDGRVALVAGIGGNSTQEVVSCLKHFDLSGYDAVLSVSPYYNKPNQRGIFQHYKMVSDASPLPVIIYNVPGRTSSNITADTTLKIAEELKNIVGTKEASGSFDQIMTIIKHRPKEFLVISGDDLITLPLIASGADGVISVIANAYPKDFSEMARLALAGNFSSASRLHYRLMGITQAIFADGSPAGVKSVLELLKICNSTVRLPLYKVNKKTQKRIEELVRKYK